MRRCALTGIRTQTGHNVSHSNRKTKRRFVPNVQKVSLHSDALGREVGLRVSTRALRTVQKAGGLDAYLVASDERELPEEAARLKRAVHRALAGRRPSNRGVAG
jgi:large subunit ribosomal protein L28